jgi:hypothetical protein
MRLTLLCSLPFIYAVWSYNTLTVGRSNIWIKNRVLIAVRVIDKCWRLLAFCWGMEKDKQINRTTTAGVRNQTESITSRIPNMWLFHNGQLRATDAWDVTTGNLEDIYWRTKLAGTFVVYGLTSFKCLALFHLCPTPLTKFHVCSSSVELIA